MRSINLFLKVSAISRYCYNFFFRLVRIFVKLNRFYNHNYMNEIETAMIYMATIYQTKQLVE